MEGRVVEEMEVEFIGGVGRPKGKLGAVFLFWVQVVGCWKKKEKGMKERRNKRGCFYMKG